MLTCHFCGNSKFNIWYRIQDFEIEEKSDYLIPSNESAEFFSIICPKCGITIKLSEEETWRDYSSTNLFYDSSTQLWDSKPIPKQVTESDVMKEIQKLGKDKLAQLIQSLKEEI